MLSGLPAWSPWDHPRPCGEKHSHLMQTGHLSGSPPPMRGKVGHFKRPPSTYGITPAHAGKSDSVPVLALIVKDHPRPCGEKALRRNDIRLYPGSPPPMRGKVRGGANGYFYIRITPAHAGKSLCARITDHKVWDHPRPCGEKRFKGRKQSGR